MIAGTGTLPTDYSATRPWNNEQRQMFVQGLPDGKTVAAYCDEFRVPVAQYYNWRAAIQRQAQEQLRAQPQPQPRPAYSDRPAAEPLRPAAPAPAVAVAQPVALPKRKTKKKKMRKPVRLHALERDEAEDELDGAPTESDQERLMRLERELAELRAVVKLFRNLLEMAVPAES